MVTCLSCGSDVTGKKFCPRCGSAVQAVTSAASGSATCPQCHAEVKPGAAFCMHCGASLRAQSAAAPSPAAAVHLCPACNTAVAATTAFCTNCGHDMRAGAVPQQASAFCTNCGTQNASGVHFCTNCGHQLDAQQNYAAPGQYTQYPQSQYPQQQYPQYQQQYAQTPYPQQPQYQQQYAQGSYQPQPMMGQQPMVLRCPVCMAIAPLNTSACVSCHTSLAGVMPTPADMAYQGQQAGGLGGFMQGNGGKYAMGALGGAAAVIGGEMMLNGLVNGIENRVDGDMGYGGYHHHHHRDEGLLGGLGELADDIGL
jgi:predicted amidophosphoribosyltransferase